MWAGSKTKRFWSLGRLVRVPTTVFSRLTSRTVGRCALLVVVFGIFRCSAYQQYAFYIWGFESHLTCGMSNQGLNGGDQALGNKHRFQFQYARHLQQGGESEVAAAFDSGDGALWLPYAMPQAGLCKTFGFTGLPDLMLHIC